MHKVCHHYLYQHCFLDVLLFLFVLQGYFLLKQIDHLLFLLQDFEGLQGARFGVIEDLSKPDTLLFGYALLPFVMSILSLVNVFVSSKELGARIQGGLIALIFLVLLYAMPSALVLYWTMSMIFWLARTLWRHSAFSDKSLILRLRLGHHRLGSSRHPSLENNDFSSKILECQRCSKLCMENSSFSFRYAHISRAGLQCADLRIFRKARPLSPLTFQNSIKQSFFRKFTQPHRLCCDSNQPILAQY